jgi:hypothetical protein
MICKGMSDAEMNGGRGALSLTRDGWAFFVASLFFGFPSVVYVE